MASRTVSLQGPPGTGKTTMMCLTAVRKPVHVIDVDRKIMGQANLMLAIAKKELSVWEVAEPLVEVAMAKRVHELTNNIKMTKPPKGWKTFAELVDQLAVDPTAQAAGTWGIDSWTFLTSHLLRHIMQVSDNRSGNMRPQDWGALLQMSQEALTIMMDLAKQYDKDLIVTVHEAVSEMPIPGTKVMLKQQGDMKGRDYLGAMNLRVKAAIQGQFGLEFGRFFNESYALSVEVDNDKPKWVCRVKPDGVRDLRTSFDLPNEEYEPDFRKIWRP